LGRSAEPFPTFCAVGREAVRSFSAPDVPQFPFQIQLSGHLSSGD